ncbi:MAG TPA: glycoside hydrolase family 2 protein, partial [Burkholderiaceae bacterium]|nr:glycoside hydrolase family 2 protein [Burkholderiaceae bacterium]
GADAPVVVDLGRVGFRTLALDTRDGGFALGVNGVPVFCRGACWTPLDPVALSAPAEATRAALEQVRDAGMNMLRVSGSLVYEDDHFHDACDALGILVWQDFMFANMDYPAADPAFAASVRAEVSQQLARWQARPSLAVLCGNSEAEQQAAMWGSPREDWSQPLFARDLAELAAAACPGVPYWPSSAHGGAFPHQNNAGTTSYYGVGAYRRGPDDARRSGLRFATECLAFANVPPASTIARMPGGHALRVHHPAWKARTPRDLGAGWDFEDVRDHYLQQLYRVDPVALRSADHDRYLALSRAVPGEVMGAAFAEWRRGGSSCRGALVWFLRDLWPGAGWGVLDDRGVPKAAFHALKRAFAPVAVFLADEGTNGLELTIVNEPDRALDARIEIALYRDDGLPMQRAEQAHTIAARATLARPAAEWFDAFIDLTHAYRFGPAEHALVVATLRDGRGGHELAQAFHFPTGLPSRCEHGIGLSAQARWHDDGHAELHLRTQRFAQSIEIDIPGFAAADAGFHLAPGAERCVRLVPLQAAGAPALAGHVQALNDRTRVVVEAA